MACKRACNFSSELPKLKDCLYMGSVYKKPRGHNEMKTVDMVEGAESPKPCRQVTF